MATIFLNLLTAVLELSYFYRTMIAEPIVIMAHLLVALAAGGLIGFERSYHGRPAGFRTHALVCVASSALMLVTVYQQQWFPAESGRAVNIDPTRMAQGIMTGIGFLGAGVIFKEGLTVRGLTTAASIWITAAIGILSGIGFYFPLVVTTVFTLGTLSVFRLIEARMPVHFYAQLDVKFSADAILPEQEFRRLVADHGFTIANLSYHYSGEERFFEYGMVIRTRERANATRLAESLRKAPVLDFRLLPMGD
jgi:putative Mg2+ transporter-C (MgtC) family protein